MSYLFSRLPPFAADYSGIASALHDLGGLVVIHDASGCTGSYTGYDEPRWFSGRSNVFCSGLREFDAIMGNDEKLLNNIQEAANGRGCGFVAVVGSPVPMLVGFDYDGFANLVEHETGLPAFGFHSTGLGLYDKGLSDAFLETAGRFVADPNPSFRRGANILGASPLDNFDAEAVALLTEFLDQAGFPTVSVWGQGSDLKTIARAADAEVNLVVAASALPLARHMKKRWGIPYAVGLPLDSWTAGELKDRLSQAVDGAPAVVHSGDERSRKQHASQAGKVILVGEAVRMNALRAELRRVRPDLTVRIAGFFAWDIELAEEGDRFLADEEQAVAWLAAEDASVVVGDPLLRQLLPSHAQGRFVDDPHLAVSGRLHRYSVARHFGRDGAAFLDSILKACDAASL